ncbi:MAG: glycosyltransferase [Candidatus ainarchaeum sp.]|nr:glycosyltransferase [Candidatus ainarchaeum sp.]
MGLLSSKGLYNILKISKWKKKSTEEFFENKSRAKPLIYFYLFIPALREQKVIAETLEFISKMNYPTNKFEIIVALDKKEQGNFTTKDVVKKYLEKKANKMKISFVEYSGNGQKRSFQLNEALKKIINKKTSKKNIFVGVYDADSRPNLNTLSYINYKFFKEKKMVFAFQQTINYLLNSEKISNLKNSSLLLGNAYYQTLWNYISEINQFLKNNARFKKRKESNFPPYCMGHGEFFELETLKSIGGFPNNGPADGIQIGFILALKRIKIIPIPLDDSCESPEKLSVLFKQHSFWFCGNINFFKIISKEKFSFSRIMQTLNHLFLCGKWLVRPFFYSITLIYAIIVLNYLAILVLLIMPFLYYLLGYYLIKQNFEQKILKLKYCGVEIPLAMYFKSFGAVNGLIKTIKYYFFNKDYKFSKVER